jgi:hypothetical protein
MANELTIEQLGQEAKKKYPQYESMGDADVGNAILKKYPQYQSRVVQSGQAESEKKKGMFPLVSKGLATAGAAISGIGATLGALPGGIDEQERQRIQNELTRERRTGFGISRPAGIDDQGNEKKFGGQVADIVGSGLGIGSAIAPGTVGTKALTQGASLGTRMLGMGAAGALQAGLPALGQGIAEQKPFGEIAKKTASNAALGFGVGAAIPFAGAAALRSPAFLKAVGQGAKKVPSLVKEGTESAFTALGAAKRLGQKVPETFSSIGENIGAGVSTMAERSTMPQPIRRALSAGIPEETVDLLQKATPDDIGFVKKMVTNANKRVSPQEVVGEPALKRFEHIRKQAQSVGKKMESEIDSMMLKQNNVPNPRQEMMQKLADEGGIQFNAKGKIVETGSFTTEEANLLKRLVDEVPNGKLLTPKQVVLAKRKLSATIREASQTKGISPGNLSKIAGSLEDVLTSKLSQEYLALSKQYAMLKAPIDDFLRLVGLTKKKGSYFSFDDIIKTGDARVGNKLRRLLGNAPDDAQDAIGLLDEVAKQFGYKGTEDIRSLAEIAKIMERVYELTGKASLEGSVAGGMDSSAGMVGMILQKVKQSAGSTPLNRKKAFEELVKLIAP